MFPPELAKVMRSLCNTVKWTRLPVESRDPSRLARRMEPVRCLEGDVLALGLCEGIDCYLCLWSGVYKVSYDRIYADDVLSGIRHWVRVPRGIVDGRIVWEGSWRGDRFRIDHVECFARARIGMSECITPGVHCEVASRVASRPGEE